MSQPIFLNPKSIDFMLEQPKQIFSWIGFDLIDDCNLHCLYCHNPRTKKLTDIQLFTEFVNTKVESVDVFQIGCAMEPCMDDRLLDFLAVISGSPAHPKTQFKVHTNGTLLNKHNHRNMRDLGLTHLAVSIDTAVEETFSSLRGGAKLVRVFRNIKAFHAVCPDVIIQFVATVNKANIDEMDLLIQKGREVGASRFHFREMYHHLGGQVVEDDKVAPLVLETGRFEQMKQAIEAKFADEVGLFFGASNLLNESSLKAKANSFEGAKSTN